MKIKISGLAETVHHFHFVLQKKEIDLGSPFVGEPVLDLTLDKSARQILLEGTLQLKALMHCDRCNQENTVEFTSGFKNVYLFGDGEKNEDEDNLFFLPHEADKIDITREIYDYAGLAIPMRYLCREECAGLCPNCGVNKNETSCSCTKETGDPRWDVLKNLKFDDETN